MNCPHCEHILSPGARQCPQCTFSLTQLQPVLGDQWVRLDRITDVTHSLRLGEFRALEIELDEFERCFPQSFVAVYVGQLPKNLRPAELGFWLLNHGAFNTPQVTKRNDFGIVTVVDFHSGHCSITVGYAIETLVKTKALQRVSLSLAKSLRESRMGDGLVETVRSLAKQLQNVGKPEARQPGDHGTVATGIGLSTLRAGHRESKSTQRPESQVAP